LGRHEAKKQRSAEGLATKLNIINAIALECRRLGENRRENLESLSIAKV
jgi:hypothetical protein